MLGAYLVSGCPSPAAKNLLGNHGPLSQEAVAQETVEDPNAVSFEVCAAVDSWQRPSDAEQSKQLGADPRYSSLGEGDALTDGSLKAASNQFWNHEAISFTTYGLSARMEPENLTGLWTVSNELQGCYGAESTVAINEGDRAETWLLNKQITNLKWEGDRYVMTVEHASTGMQVIQFDRVDELATLPLDVVTANGDAVAVVSGDWQ